MAEQQPDTKLIAWLGMPEPPHRLCGGLSPARRALGWVAAVLLIAGGVALPVAYFGGTAIGRGLLVDTALALGMGTALPDARVVPGECRNNAARPGSRVPGQWECPFTIEARDLSAERVVATISRYELEPHGAGRVLGAVGVLWSPGIMLARWWNDVLMLVMPAALLWLGFAAIGWSRDGRGIAIARDARVRSVDLLTWQGRPHFAFIDDAGSRQFDRAAAPMFPLVLDGVRTTGAALVTGRHAILLDERLRPLDLEDARRLAILERVRQVQRQCQVRPALPPQTGDPPTLAARIERIEREMRGASPAWERLYDEAWRLVWDSDDAAVADRALAARDAIAQRLGPHAAHAALLRARDHKLA